MTPPPPQRLALGDIPQKYLLVPTHGREPRVVVSHSDVEDFVAVRGVGLDQPGFRSVGVRFRGVVEVDGAVGRAGEDVGGGEAARVG